VAILVSLRRIESRRSADSAARQATTVVERDDWAAFARLTLALVGRSVLFYGLNTFVPLYWVFALHQSKAAAGSALAVLLVAGAGGTLLGGRLADRFSRRAVVLVTSAVSVPLLGLTLILANPWLAELSLIPLALAVYAPSSVLVVLGQEYLPTRVGTASGVTMGLSFSIGGLLVPVIGWIGDHAGLQAALFTLALSPALATGIAVTLPERSRRSEAASG
jgi:MFS transporter, FSR family, fosmidomycin resistance protein